MRRPGGLNTSANRPANNKIIHVIIPSPSTTTRPTMMFRRRDDIIAISNQPARTVAPSVGLLVARDHNGCKQDDTWDNCAPLKGKGFFGKILVDQMDLIHMLYRTIPLLTLFLLAPNLMAQSSKSKGASSSSGSMQVFPSKYYIIHSDLPTR